MNLQCGLDHARADGVGSADQADVFSQQLCRGKKLERPISVCIYHQVVFVYKGLILLRLRNVMWCLRTSMVWSPCRCTA